MKTYGLLSKEQKSFGDNAHVQIADDGTETLYSYGVPIIRRNPNGELQRLWNGWTTTTGRHIAAFCGLNKAAFKALPYVQQ